MTGPRARLVDPGIAAWLEDRSRTVGNVDSVVEAVVQRTSYVRPLPRWAQPAAWVPSWVPTVPARTALVPMLILLALVIALVVAAALFVGSRQQLPAPFGPAANGRIAIVSGGHVWTVAADGSHPRQLSFGETRDISPVFSRDGTEVAWRRLTADEPADDPERFVDLVVADVDGGNVRVLMARAMVGGPSWSPDGRQIAVAWTDEAGEHLGIINVDGSGIRDLGPQSGGAWGPVWSPRGTWIAFQRGFARLSIVHPDGTGLAQLTNNTYEETGSQGDAAAWSVDEQRVAFAAGHVDADRSIYLVDLSGYGERRISAEDRFANDVAFAPDGRAIAWLEQGAGRGPIVVVSDRDGGNQHILPGHYGWAEPIWSPDGSRIFVFDDRPGPDDVPGEPVMVALDPFGNEPAQVIRAPPGTTFDATDGLAGSWQRIAP